MPCLPRSAFALLVTILLAVSACGCRAPDTPEPSSDTLAGIWVLRLEGRPFMILALDGPEEALTGTLSHPQPISSDGVSVSNIGDQTVVERVVGASRSDDTLRLVTVDPGDAEARLEYELRRISPDRLHVRPAGAPFEPWTFVRHPDARPPEIPTDWTRARSYAVDEPDVPPNAEMAAIYEADQAVRQSPETFEADAARIAGEDAARRARVRALLDAGELRAAADLRLAALVFQHGEDPRDVLLAHTLAMVALAGGDRGASWIAAATLDRYLQSTGRAQIFGTAFQSGSLDQDPYDRTLVPDALRRQMGVPPMAEQQAQMRALLQVMREQAVGR